MDFFLISLCMHLQQKKRKLFNDHKETGLLKLKACDSFEEDFAYFTKLPKYADFENKYVEMNMDFGVGERLYELLKANTLKLYETKTKLDLVRQNLNNIKCKSLFLFLGG